MYVLNFLSSQEFFVGNMGAFLHATGCILLCMGYLYLADHGSTDHGSADHVFQRIPALLAPSGMIPSHLVVLFASSEGFTK